MSVGDGAVTRQFWAGVATMRPGVALAESGW